MSDFQADEKNDRTVVSLNKTYDVRMTLVLPHKTPVATVEKKKTAGNKKSYKLKKRKVFHSQYTNKVTSADSFMLRQGRWQIKNFFTFVRVGGAIFFSWTTKNSQSWR